MAAPTVEERRRALERARERRQASLGQTTTPDEGRLSLMPTWWPGFAEKMGRGEQVYREQFNPWHYLTKLSHAQWNALKQAAQIEQEERPVGQKETWTQTKRILERIKSEIPEAARKGWTGEEPTEPAGFVEEAGKRLRPAGQKSRLERWAAQEPQRIPMFFPPVGGPVSVPRKAAAAVAGTVPEYMLWGADPRALAIQGIVAGIVTPAVRTMGAALGRMNAPRFQTGMNINLMFEPTPQEATRFGRAARARELRWARGRTARREARILDSEMRPWLEHAGMHEGVPPPKGGWPKVTTAPVKPKPKPPWEMTSPEYAHSLGYAERYDVIPSQAMKRMHRHHYEHIIKAAKRGETIPREVLEEYPKAMETYRAARLKRVTFGARSMEAMAEATPEVKVEFPPAVAEVPMRQVKGPKYWRRYYGYSPAAYLDTAKGPEPLLFHPTREADLFHLEAISGPASTWRTTAMPGKDIAPTMGFAQRAQKRTNAPFFTVWQRYRHAATNLDDAVGTIEKFALEGLGPEDVAEHSAEIVRSLGIPKGGVPAIFPQEVVLEPTRRLARATSYVMADPKPERVLRYFRAKKMLDEREVGIVRKLARDLRGTYDSLFPRYEIPHYREYYVPRRRVPTGQIGKVHREFRRPTPELTARLPRTLEEPAEDIMDDAIEIFRRYVREGEADYWYGHLRRPTNELIQTLRSQGMEGGAKWVEMYADMVEGTSRTIFDKELARAGVRLANAIGKSFGIKKLAGVTEAGIERAAYAGRGSIYASQLVRPSLVYRNYWQGPINAMPWVGPRNYVRALFKVSAALPIRPARKPGGLWPTYPLTQQKRGLMLSAQETRRIRGILSRARIIREFTPEFLIDPAKEQNPYIRLLRRTMQGFGMADYRDRGAIYLAKYDGVMDAARQLQAGKITRAQFRQAVQWKRHSPVLRQTFEPLLRQDKYEELAHWMADDVTAWTHYLYTRGQKPPMYRGTILGPAIGQFGTWALHYTEYMRHMIETKNYGQLAQVIGEGIMLNYLHRKVFRIRNAEYWYGLGPMTGMGQDIPSAIGGPMIDIPLTGIAAASQGAAWATAMSPESKKYRGRKAVADAKKMLWNSTVFVPAGGVFRDAVQALSDEERETFEKIMWMAGFKRYSPKKKGAEEPEPGFTYKP